ncbi:MAG: metal-sensitive transcriptional regulator [Phycisphaerales bacterium]|nr:metal-sensitive transcriptional regulator [Phycisphaerales bacterium]
MPTKKRTSPSNRRSAAPAKADQACCTGPIKRSASTPATSNVGPGAHAAGVDDELKAANLKHLKRIEGQVRGIRTMIDQDRYCADIIQQCAAVQESLRSVARNLLKNHLRHCAAQALQGSNAARQTMTTELIALVERIAR